MKSLRTASLLAVLALSGRAQEPENVFYKAFYLDVGERKYEEAIELYRKFLAAAPEHKLAPNAARSAIQLLHRINKTDDANKASTEWAEILKKAPPPADTTQAGAARRPQGGDDMAGPGGRRAMDPAQREQMIADRTAVVEKLKKDIAAAEKDGAPADKIADLKGQLERAERQLEGIRSGRGGMALGGPGGGQGGQRGGQGFTPPKPLADMTDAERTEWVATTKERVSRTLDFMRQNGQEDRAKQMEEGIKKIEELIKGGKFAEAEEAIRNLMPQRRRGGEAGGPGGGAGGGGGGRPPAGGQETRPIR